MHASLQATNWITHSLDSGNVNLLIAWGATFPSRICSTWFHVTSPGLANFKRLTIAILMICKAIDLCYARLRVLCMPFQGVLMDQIGQHFADSEACWPALQTEGAFH